MTTSLSVFVGALGFGRIAIGLAPFLAAGPTSRLLGFPRSHDTATARLMARWFGVRDAGLGVLAFYAIAHPETATFLFLFNAAMDLGDLFATSLPLLRRDGIDRAALASAAMAIGGATMWLLAFLLR